MAVEGVQFITDSEGRRVAVVLDLGRWSEVWEDIYDNAVADARSGEESTSLEEFEAGLRLDGLLG